MTRARKDRAAPRSDVAVQNLWRYGRLGPGRRGRGCPRLLFGLMHEDWAVEASVFPVGSRVLCIGSAGCTALALAAQGRQVLAVDLNPAQVEYIRGRAAGAPARRGHVDRMLAFGRLVARAAGHRRDRLRQFLEMDDPAEQAAFWQRRLDGLPWRVSVGLALHPWMLRRLYAEPFRRAVPARFATVVRRRLARGFATHPNRTNPYAWRLLRGTDPPGFELPRPTRPPVVARGDVAALLEICPRGFFDGFALANILDGADDAYRQRLTEAMRRAAAPGAMMVLRSIAEPTTDADEAWAARDRSMVWGSVRVEAVQPVASDTAPRASVRTLDAVIEAARHVPRVARPDLTSTPVPG